MLDTVKIGRNGALVIPAKMRRRLGLDEGDLVLIEETGDGLIIRPAVAMPIEVYSKERKAEFLLNNTVDPDDYEAARIAVREMDLDPDTILHERPPH
ncbi:MAG: AbrB/MazE/SpoVT family DNA-binding domain-containing protein [Gammaproteobacteria bacterium]